MSDPTQLRERALNEPSRHVAKSTTDSSFVCYCGETVPLPRGRVFLSAAMDRHKVDAVLAEVTAEVEARLDAARSERTNAKAHAWHFLDGQVTAFGALASVLRPSEGEK